MLVNEFSDGMEIDQVLLVRESERRQRRDGGEYLRLQLGDRTGAVVSMVWEELEGIEQLARAGEPVHVRGATPCIHASARRSTCAASSGPSRAASRPRTCSTVRRAVSSRWRRRCASCSRRSRSRTCGLCWSGCSARTPSCGPATAWRRRRSTTTRHTATACSSTASAWRRRSARSAPRSPASTATSRSPGRCCTTSASSRPTPIRTRPARSST